MSKLENYKEFKKHQPKYASWKDERDIKNQKKISYLKTNPIPKDEFNKETQRAKAVLNAIDIMDEHSQTKAEDAEQVIQALKLPMAQVATWISLAFGGLSIFLTKGAKDAFNNLMNGQTKGIHKLLPAAFAFIVPFTILTSAFASWGASKEIQASRQGRKEAMDNELSSLNQFAILTDEQQKQANEIAKNIEVIKKEEKAAINATNGFGIADSFKTIFAKDNKKIIKADVKLDTRANLSQDEILEAKKDKELIQNVVEKIDIASQDYAENAELAVGTIQTLSSFSGLGIGALLNFLLGKIPSVAKHSKTIGAIATMSSVIIGGIIAAKIDKQASRVGRFKAKQELLNNPEELIYVDENKYKNQQTELQKKKKQNYFSNIIQMFKDNAEYNRYLKENNVSNIQKRKAKDKIELTQEQKDRASQLQRNTFNMFNKLDEKSQTYSESTEAIGEMFENVITLIIGLPAMLLSGVGLATAKTSKNKILSALGMLSGVVIPILSNIIVTKEQKKASRVADMQAIKELDDYRYFTSDKAQIQTKDGTKQDKTVSPLLRSKIEKSI